MSKTYIGISRDHSGSMSSLVRAATKDYNDCIKSIQKESVKNKQETYVSVVGCGATAKSFRPRSDGVQLFEENVDVCEVAQLSVSDYRAAGNTPLFDSVGQLIEMLKRSPCAKKKDTSFLVMVITDGEENASIKWSSDRLLKEIKKLQATDKWTFVFRVPRGYKAKLVQGFDIPDGNVLEWEQTDYGLQVAQAITSNSLGSYYTARSKGITSTRSFFADIDSTAQKKVKRVLTDVSGEYNKVSLSSRYNGQQIRDVCERIWGIPYQKGSAFYQLTKSEEVQEYKEFLILEIATGHVYAGADARELLNLPEDGSIRLRPGDTGGKYEIFVQSTSINRKLQSGTTLFYKV